MNLINKKIEKYIYISKEGIFRRGHTYSANLIDENYYLVDDQYPIPKERFIKDFISLKLVERNSKIDKLFKNLNL